LRGVALTFRIRARFHNADAQAGVMASTNREETSSFTLEADF
jgi:hypothetical protein